MRYLNALHYFGMWGVGVRLCKADCPVCQGYWQDNRRRRRRWDLEVVESRFFIEMDEDLYDGFDFRKFPWRIPDAIVDGVNWDRYEGFSRYQSL